MLITDPRILLYSQCISAIHSRWEPHPGQVAVGRALFNDLKRFLFIANGRKWGKTELILYFLTRWGMEHPDEGGCWYVCPELKHTRKIIWNDPRIINFVPKQFVRKINHTEMRIELITGNFIQLDGSDNYEAHRGTRPSLVVYEESKDHKRRFREIMRPNMSVFNAPEIHIGTPPSDDDHEDVQNYWDELEAEAKNPENTDAFYYTAPSWDNPHFDKVWGAKEKKRLYDRGEGHVWEREYGAKRVKGGTQKIFPMLPNKDLAFIPHDELMRRLAKDKRKLHWFWWADPAGATCFAVLFMAINPYTKDVYCLDEIYEKDQAEMTVKRIGLRIIEKRDELNGDMKAWRGGYDEASTWFLNEWIDSFPDEDGLEPTQKAQNDKDNGLSLIKDIMLAGKWHMSDRCKYLFWELDNYRKDKNGKIPKKNDHLIDDARYCLAAEVYSLTDQSEPVPKEQHEMYRGTRMEDDYREMRQDYGDDDDSLD